MTIFIEVMVPVLLIFGAGYIVQKWKKLNIQSVSTIALYILIPCLVFETLYTSELDKAYLHMIIFSFFLLLILILIIKLYVYLNKYTLSVENGLILSTAFMNSGNYGAPIVLFAFGETAFSFAVAFMVLQQVIMNFFGIYYAAKGKEGARTAIKSVFAMPSTYAVIVAVLLNAFNIPVSTNIFSVIELVSNAAIPLVMLVLGMQLAEIKLVSFQWSKIYFGITTRMIISPVIAYIITMFIFDIDPLLQLVLVLLSAMPSAATTVLFALQFKTEPELVSSITLMSTLISVFSISILLNIVM